MSLLSWLGRTIGLGTGFGKFWASFGGRNTDSNEIVTDEKAIGLAAINRAVRLYAETVGTLPKDVFKVPSGGGDPVKDTDNQYDPLIRISPNEDQTTVEFWESMVAAEKLCGNGYAIKKRVGARLAALELPRQCEPYRRTSDFSLRYKGSEQNGTPFDLAASEIFHLKGFSFGGDVGMSTVFVGANSIGNLLSANKQAGKILRSGLSSSGFLETGQILDEPDRKRLTDIMDAYSGSDNAGKMMILEGGMKYNRLSMSAIDAQLLAQIGFGIEEVGRWFGIPPILLGHNAAGQTMWGSGIESIILAWYTLGLRAELHRIEAAISKRLIEPKDRGKYFVKINVDGLLRGDSAAQAALFSAAAQNGWFTRNEIRKLLDYPPKPGGDDLTVQVNMALLKDLGSVQQNTAQQARQALRLLIGADDIPPTPAPAKPVQDMREAA